jgi:copper chaperone
MQFELTSSSHDAATLAAALRPLDPDVRIALDAKRGRLEVIGTPTAAQVMGALQEIGCAAQPLVDDVHISGGSTCCGHCA